ncbi:MAG TPA: ArgE/DapE family deacylase [Bryobacteraceae bacterium]|nr:ArgE/DapE family deacylase [Bryobacteraceae bacterium]
MDALTTLLRDLVAIDSVNPDLVPGGAGERQIAGFIAEWLARAGVEVETDEPRPGRISVVGRVRGTGGGKSLMLNAHVDTVGVAGMTNPHQPVIEGNRLYGRGSYDMKGGLTAILMTASTAVGQGWRGDLLVTAVCDEEYASIGTESVLKRWTADAAIVTEPTALDVCVAHKGFVWVDIETQGVASHGSRPDLGVDAIAHMGRVLVGLEELNRGLQSRQPHRLLGCASLHASLVGGGQELSSYPEVCRLSVERRTVPGENITQVEREFADVLAALGAADSKFKASMKTTFVRDPFEVAEDDAIVSLLHREAERKLGREVPIVGSTPWMDAALTSAAGIPTVVFGPGGAGAHAVVEWVDLEQVRQCHEILHAVAAEFCR